MLVKDLIEKLNKMPQDMEVKMKIRVYEDYDSHNEYLRISKVNFYYDLDFIKEHNIKVENFVEIS
jgi:hypothetical protein